MFTQMVVYSPFSSPLKVIISHVRCSCEKACGLSISDILNSVWTEYKCKTTLSRAVQREHFERHISPNAKSKSIHSDEEYMAKYPFRSAHTNKLKYGRLTI